MKPACMDELAVTSASELEQPPLVDECDCADGYHFKIDRQSIYDSLVPAYRSSLYELYEVTSNSLCCLEQRHSIDKAAHFEQRVDGARIPTDDDPTTTFDGRHVIETTSDVSTVYNGPTQILPVDAVAHRRLIASTAQSSFISCVNFHGRKQNVN